MKKDPDLYLRHILEAIEAIKMFTEGGKRVFLKDRKTRDAVIRNLEVIGEAVKQLPADFKKKHPVFRSEAFSRQEIESTKALLYESDYKIKTYTASSVRYRDR